jgi:hypothetical protein
MRSTTTTRPPRMTPRRVVPSSADLNPRPPRRAGGQVATAWPCQRIIVEVMAGEPSGHGWRPAAALVGLVAVTATVGVLISVLQRPPTYAPIRPTTIPTLDLSGTWSGTCSSTSNGFCTLTLTQTGNALDGTFLLWSPPGKPLDIRGNLTRSTITLRGSGVVFTGTLSGRTLSGTYTDTATGKTYSWSVILSA